MIISKKEIKIKKGEGIFAVAILLILLFFSQVNIASGAVSISCDDCLLNDCKCSSDCQNGFLDIYEKECMGVPKYELTILDGNAIWYPNKEGIYYSKILCDNGKISGCEIIEVPSKIVRKAESEVEDSFYMLLILFTILILGVVISFFVFLKEKLKEEKKTFTLIKNKINKKRRRKGG